MHGERLKLWEEFNTAWLSILQKQKEMVQEMAEAGQAPRPPQSLMEYDFMESMGKELVGLCDSMEKHGLVDYQMGVWEEEIVASKFAGARSRFKTVLTLGSPHKDTGHDGGADGRRRPRTRSCSAKAMNDVTRDSLDNVPIRRTRIFP